MDTRAKSVAKEATTPPRQAMGPPAARRHDVETASAVPLLRKASGYTASVSGDQFPAGGRTGVEALQRLAGNRAVCELLAVGQAKLDVGPAGDRYEQEADALARRVVATLQGASQNSVPATDVDDSGETVGRAFSTVTGPEVGVAGGEVAAGTEAAIRSARGGGAPLDSGVRGAMESAFGADFGQVKLHTGPASAELNDRVQAKAFTIGSDIFFRDGVPDGRTSHGQELLAHELTHTIQQGGAKTHPAS
ncbi:MAG TPA: DUF4157 domain-containing protein [Acidimicrobiales bacterium]|nr:DUF4157 domain-containing protein [Acidimicrobiales bacterium]